MSYGITDIKKKRFIGFILRTKGVGRQVFKTTSQQSHVKIRTRQFDETQKGMCGILWIS